mgnify:FL=1
MSDFNIARKNMIHNQLMANNIVEDYILKAFEVIPRENFLPFEKRPKAYLDEDIEIMADRYLIEPRIIGNIIKLSKIKKNHIVMDLACSTGYSSAILSKLSKKVYAIDNKTKLIEQADLNIKKLNISNIVFLNKNPVNGLKKKFDIIFIFGGVQYIPANLFDSLKSDGGSLITVLYDNNDIGKIHIVKKINGKISRTNYISAQTPILKEFQKTTKEFIF